MSWLNPNKTRPIALHDGTEIRNTVYLNKVIEHPRIAAGDFSYASSFDPVAELLRIRWWDWTPEKIAANLAAIEGADLAALSSA